MTSVLFEIGYGMSGEPEPGLELTITINKIAAGFSLIYLLLSLGMMYILTRGFLLKGKVYYFVFGLWISSLLWQISQIIRYSNVCMPLFHWIYNLLGSVCLLLAVMGQMELLKLFITNSVYLTLERIKILQIAFVLFHFISMGGLYIGMGYMGIPWPSIFKSWYMYGFEIFTATCMLYETFHAYYITTTVKKLTAMKLGLMIGDLNYKIDSKHFREMNILVLCSFTSDWTGLIIWLIAWYIGGQVGAGISIIGSILGMAHLFFITLMFKMIKHIREKTDSISKELGSVTTELTQKP